MKIELNKPLDTHDAQAANLRLLFLDIDGVLNDHVFDETAQSCTLLSSCVAELNRVLANTECRIVVSSAWRYAVLNGWMSIDGFEYLLRSHGVAAGGRIDGVTGADPDLPGDELADHGPAIRAAQIRDYVRSRRPNTWAVLDDLDLPIERLVRTDGRLGLQAVGAHRATELLLSDE